MTDGQRGRRSVGSRRGLRHRRGTVLIARTRTVSGTGTGDPGVGEPEGQTWTRISPATGKAAEEAEEAAVALAADTGMMADTGTIGRGMTDGGGMTGRGGTSESQGGRGAGVDPLSGTTGDEWMNG